MGEQEQLMEAIQRSMNEAGPRSAPPASQLAKSRLKAFKWDETVKQSGCEPNPVCRDFGDAGIHAG